MSKKGYKQTEEHKRKISQALMGIKHSEERKKNISEAHKGIKCPNRRRPPPFSEEHKRKIGRRGEKSPNWKGGKSFEPYSVDWTTDLKNSIRKRDNHICQICGIHQDELIRRLDVHHIDYDKMNLNPDNLISLCRKCHIPTNFNRNYWIDYFRKTTTQIIEDW